MATGINFADPLRPLNSTFWCKTLPPNAALNPNSAAIVAEVVRQSKILTPIVNYSKWTAEPTIVPANQPLIPVTCNHDSVTQAIGAGGLPIPPSLTPTSDQDSAILIYQPDATNPYGSAGFMWELQHYVPPTSTTQASAGWIGRMSGVNNRGTGHYVNWTASGYEYQTPGATYSTYELASWGIQGSGLPYAPGVLTLRDIERGMVDHALLLEVYDAGAGARVWPATRSDGGAGPTNPASVLAEGMWLRLPDGYAIPRSLDPITQLYMQGLRDYGWIITDRTLSCLAVRAAPSCASAIGGNNHLAGLPWADIQCLAVGSDSVWHP